MRKSAVSFIALNRKTILVAVVVLSLTVLSAITWRTTAQNRANDRLLNGLENSETNIGGLRISGQGVKDDAARFLANRQPSEDRPPAE